MAISQSIDLNNEFEKKIAAQRLQIPHPAG